MRKLHFTKRHAGLFLVLTVLGIAGVPPLVHADLREVLGAFLAWLPLFGLIVMLVGGIALIGASLDEEDE